MGRPFQNIIWISIRRRKKDVRRVSLIAFLAATFIILTMRFQESMDVYQHRANQLQYGEWYVSEAVEKDGTSDIALSENVYFDRCGVMKAGASVSEAKAFIGTVDERTISDSHVHMLDGEFPANSGEIAMELPVLGKLGLSTEIGQELTLEYIDGTGKNVSKKYVLSGILASYTGCWINGSDLPEMLVTEEEFQAIGVTSKTIYMYYLSDGIEIKNPGQFVDSLRKTNGEELTYNSYVEETTVWGNKTAYYQVVLMLMVISICALMYTYFSYTQNRKKEYYRLRCFGVSKGQLRHIIVMEGIYAMVPWMLMGFASGFVLSLFLGVLLMHFFQTEYLFTLGLDTVLMCIVSMAVTTCFSIGLVTLLVRGKRVYENVSQIPVGKLHRISHMHTSHKNVYKGFHRRENRLFPLRRIFAAVLAISVMTGILLCITRVYEFKNTIYAASQKMIDFKGYSDTKHYDLAFEKENKFGTKESYSMSLIYYQYQEGIDDGFYTELAQLKGIENVEKTSFDSWLKITWDGMIDSPIREFEYNRLPFHPDEEDEHLYSYMTTFYENPTALYEQVKDEIPAEYYDPDGFERGEQVLYFCSNITSQTNELGHIEENSQIIKENTLQPGDYVTYETEGGPVQVMVAAMIYENSLHNYVKPPSYEFKASNQLGERIAELEGNTFYYNHVSFNVDSLQSFNTLNRQITELFSKYNMRYDSNFEMKTQRRNELIQKLFVFGMTSVILLSVFLVIYENMIAASLKNRKDNLTRLHRLGAPQSRLIQSEVWRCIKENSVVILAIPITLVFNYVSSYDYMMTHYNNGYDWSGFLDEKTGEWTRDLTAGIIRQLKRITSPEWMMIAVLIMFVSMLLVSLMPILKKIREMERNP